MPELPEVETTLRGITPHICEQKVTEVTIRQYKLRWAIPENMQQLLVGEILNKITRRGKYLLLEFDKGTAMIHLGMSGSMRIYNTATEAGKHDHFDIEFNNGKTLRYNDPRRFGAFLWAGTEPYKHKLLSSLGVEPLGIDFDVDYIFKASRVRNIAIKKFIMDAKLVVGVGNIYANEALHLAGIHPNRSANQISKIRYQRLVLTIKDVLEKAIKQGGTTLNDFSQVDGKPGYFAQSLNVYGRSGQACYKCASVLKEIRTA